MLVLPPICRIAITVVPGLLVLLGSLMFIAHSANAERPREEVIITLTNKQSLLPGKFEWQPELSPEGEISIQINLSLQMLEVLRGGTLIARSSISSGKPGHSTPTGTFPILEKDLTHYSNLYNNAPMHFMQRLTMQGVALHAGTLPGMPASHGCIRLPYTFARQLFKITSRGDLINVFGKASEYRPPSSKDLRTTGMLVASSHGPPSLGKAGSQSANQVLLADKVSAGLQSVTTPPETSPGRKSMARLESEELSIRNDVNLSPADRMKELKRVWAEQRALVGLP